MPIRILLPPEPLAPASRQQETIIIQSSGYRQLQRELLRYCQGEVEGRSFLIAGHRGAGKTTLVNDCVLQVGKLANGGSARPIIVRLHGPNLVRADWSLSRNGKEPGRDALSLSLSPTPPPDAAAKPSQPLDPEIVRAEYHREAEHKANEETPELRAVQIALKQITLSLHRAVMNEITTCYRDRVMEEADERKRAELFERAARLELELDQYPLPAELREFWRAGAFLQRGVLFGHQHRAADQGFRELVAVASVAQAYARVSGILKAELTQSNAASSERTTGTGKDGIDLIAPVTSLLTGGLAGTALFAGANQAA
ncbi:MAG TPA: hypothetical protein VK864_02935, partial [Longimicrobiales bacterium]|nr:hypothetical protein [Longimicrobiales bacterium]